MVVLLPACGKRVRPADQRVGSSIAFGLDSPSQHTDRDSSALIFRGGGVDLALASLNERPELSRRDDALALRTIEHVTALDAWPERTRPDLRRPVVYFANDREGRRSTFFRDELSERRRSYR